MTVTKLICNYSTKLNPVSDGVFSLSVTPEDLNVNRPASIMIRSKVEGRELRSLIRCIIGENNPFEFSLKERLKPLSGKEIEASLLRAGQIHPKPESIDLSQSVSSSTSPSEFKK